MITYKADLRRAIRAKCYDCMNGYRLDCEITSCPLYSFNLQSRLFADYWWKRPASEWSAAMDDMHTRAKEAQQAEAQRRKKTKKKIKKKRKKVKLVIKK